MSLRRTITSKLEEWKARPLRRALLVTGARQVGKTYAIREFARAHYPVFLEINFLSTPSAKAIFDADLDVASLIAGLTAFSSMPLIPGKTLVFLDEIQECPRARAAIKFLVEDGRFDFIESGSLFGVLTNEVPSLPVGYEEVVRMYPLDLSEFFDALGVQPQVIDVVRGCFETHTPVPSAIHERLTRMFRLYVVTGGMPAAVQELVDTNDLARVLEVQRSINALYRQDVARYAADKPKVHRIFDAMPAELDNENKRFKLSDLARTARMERYESGFMWLVDAGAALPCYNVQAPVRPLEVNKQHNLFKFFMCDTGLLGAAFPNPVQFELYRGDIGVNWGCVLENAVAQQLASQGYGLYYYDRSKIGEIDFVVQREGGILPIEVKSGADYKRHKALDNLMAVGEWSLRQAVVLCPGNVECDGPLLYLPWYMVMFLKDEVPESIPVEW